MKKQPRNTWKRHTAIDSLFNGGAIGIAIAVLLVSVLLGPELDAVKPAHHGTTAVLGARA